MKRISQLDGIRALAFLMVFCRHAFDVPLFWAGVDIFFVLSGFLITSILMDGAGKEGAWSHFYERRALRILPSLAICLVLATHFFQLHWGLNALWYALFAMNFAETFHAGQPGLGILWSLAVEEQFYLFWPIIVLNFTPRTVKRIAIALVCAAPVLRGIATPFLTEHWAIYYLMPFRMDLLAAGAIMAVLWRERGALDQWRRNGAGMMIAGGVFTALAIGFLPGFRALDNTIVYNVFGYSLICCMAAGLVAFTLGTERGPWMAMMTAPPIRWVGLVSYTAYLIHAGVLGLIQPFHSHIANVGLAFSLILAYASASWICIEKPILQLRPKAWLRSRQKRVAYN
jgi:peptidoglycan/LPS O-acetylase OafA/YrhL